MLTKELRSDGRAHHICGPSRLYTLAACPGSLRMSRLLPEKTTADAERGRRLHAEVAGALQTILSGKQPELGDNEVGELVGKCLEQVGHRSGIYHVEEYFEAVDAGEVVTGGTPDLVIREGVGAFIWDWKFGHALLNPEAVRIQLAAYAACIFSTFEHIEEIETVAFHVRSDNGYQWVFRRGHLQRIFQKIREIRSAAEEGPLQLAPGDHCGYCPAVATCPAAIEESVKTTDAVAHPSGPQLTRIDASILVPEDLSYWKGRVRFARQVLDETESALNDEIKERANRGEGTPGWSIQRRRGRRYIKDAQEAFQRANLPVEQFLSLVSVPASALERAWVTQQQALAAEAGGKPTKKSLSLDFERAMQGVLERGSDSEAVVAEKGGQ